MGIDQDMRGDWVKWSCLKHREESNVGKMLRMHCKMLSFTRTNMRNYDQMFGTF